MFLLLLKLAVTMGVVVGLSAIAERVSPRVAGVLAGYPLGSSIVLFFFGVEHGAVFAAESAMYMTAGLVAELVFLFCYYKFSGQAGRASIISASIVALLGFAITAWAIHFIPVTPISAVLIFFVAIIFFSYLFRRIPDHVVTERVKLSLPIVTLRALLAGGIVLLITGSAHLVGPAWAGLLGAFPTTLYPLILILHWTHGPAATHTFIKHVPRGFGSLLVYVIAVMFTYPLLDVYYGTIVSLALATVYLVAFNYLKKPSQKTKTA